jgi:hypothetical protein
MVWRLLMSAMLACALTLGGGLVLAGCGSLEIGARGKGFGVEFEIYVNAQGKKEAKLTGSLPAGLCLKVTFLDADGAPLGSTTTEVPGTVEVPDGTKGFGVEFIDCRATAGTPMASVGASISAGSHQVAPTQWHEFNYWSIDPDFSGFNPWSNTTAAVRLHLPAGVDPLDAFLAILAAGPAAAVGPEVQIDYFAQMVPAPDGARLLVADDEPIVSFDLEWNGNPDYADLASSNVTQYGTGSGWSIVQTLIPAQDFSTGQFAWNGGTISVQSASSPEPVTVLNEFQILSP